jgi:hypothetical protein
MHLADENRVVVTSLVLVDFPAGLESSLRLLLASRGTRQGQHYRLLVISSNQDRRQTAHARTALTASACLVWVLLRASWFSALSVKILFLFSDSRYIADIYRTEASHWHVAKSAATAHHFRWKLR